MLSRVDMGFSVARSGRRREGDGTAPIVVEARKGEAAVAAYAALPALPAHAGIALDARRHYGTGRHPAGLNLEHRAAYALASTLNQALLFKGEDFTKTDIAEA